MSKRRNLKWFSLASVLAAFAAVVALNALFSQAYRRVDLTRDKMYSVSAELEEIVRGLDDVATITFYHSAKLPAQFLSARRFMEDNLREVALKSGGHVVVRFESIGSGSGREEELARRGIVRLPVGIIERDQQSIANIYFHIAIQYGPREHVINMPDESGFEYRMAHGLTKVSLAEKPIVMFAQNDPAFDFLRAVDPLVRAGGLDEFFDVHYANVIEDEPLVIPANTAMLVLGKPVDFRIQELYEIDQYLMSGGHVVVFGEPTNYANPFLMFDREGSDPRYNFYEMLDAHGAVLRAALVEDYGSALEIPVSRGSGTGVTARVPSPYMAVVKSDQFSTSTQIVDQTERLLFPLSAPLEIAQREGTEVVPLAWSTDQSVLQLAPEFDLTVSENPALPAGADPKSYLLAATISGRIPSFFAGKETPEPLRPKATASQYQALMRVAQGHDGRRRDAAEEGARLTVFGSGRMYSNVMMENLGRLDPPLYGQQASFLANLLESTALGVDLMSIRRKQITIPLFQPDLSDTQRQAARLGSTFGVPVLLVLFGMVRWWRRRAAMGALRRKYAG